MRLKKRPSEHWYKLKNNRHKNSHLQNSYNKNGKKCFVFEVLLYCEPYELTRYEQFFVDKYVGLNISYNICRECVDSTKGVKLSKETCKNMSESKMGENNPNFGKHPSEESIKKMSEAKKGENNGMWGKRGKDNPLFGKHPSEEARKNMSKNHADNSGENHPMYGKHHSEEARERMSKATSGENHPMYGKTHSDESRKKMSDAQKGENHPMWGKHHSEETRKRMSKNHVGMLGKKHGDKTCKKISEATKGKNNPMFGKTGKDSPKTIKKETVLKVLKLLENGMSVVKILKEMTVGKNTVYKIKNGWYNDIYDLLEKDNTK